MTLPPPVLPQNVHFLGVCGRLVGGLAIALKALGVNVSGTDPRQFPPLTDLLKESEIPVFQSWAAEHLPRCLDAVVTGGLLGKSNEEFEAAVQRGVPLWSAGAFLEYYFALHTQNLVVTGTKGKTTTTAMLAWILNHAGQDPNFLIGGQVRAEGWPLMRLMGRGALVMEGDEYPCSAQDLMPKLHRYHPQHLIVTNLSHDHPEIYGTLAAYSSVFERACASLPSSGSLVLNSDDVGAMWLAQMTQAKVRTVGFSRQATERITAFRARVSGSEFRLAGEAFKLTSFGKLNVMNAALAAVLALSQGVSLAESAQALATFPGVKGRQELIGRLGRSFLYADEAYHPLAVRALLADMKARHPERRLVVVLYPLNTGGRSGAAQRELPDSLRAASVVLLFPAHNRQPAVEGSFSDRKLLLDLRRRGVVADSLSRRFGLIELTLKHFREGDVLLLCLPPGSDAMREGVVATLVSSLGKPLR